MATEYGYKLDPYRQLRKQKGIKGVRRTIRNTHVPSTIDQGGILTVRFPDLGKNDVIVPGTSRLSFKVNPNLPDPVNFVPFGTMRYSPFDINLISIT